MEKLGSQPSPSRPTRRSSLFARPADERERLVEPRGAFFARDAERLLFGRVGDAQSEGGEGAPTREPVEARPFLRDVHRVAPGQDLHARAELELARTAAREREPDERVGGLAGQPLGEPERVEPSALETVDELAEPRGVAQSLHAQAVPDADLHRLEPTASVSSPRRGRGGRDERVAPRLELLDDHGQRRDRL